MCKIFRKIWIKLFFIGNFLLDFYQLKYDSLLYCLYPHNKKKLETASAACVFNYCCYLNSFSFPYLCLFWVYFDGTVEFRFVFRWRYVPCQHPAHVRRLPAAQPERQSGPGHESDAPNGAAESSLHAAEHRIKSATTTATFRKYRKFPLELPRKRIMRKLLLLFGESGDKSWNVLGQFVGYSQCLRDNSKYVSVNYWVNKLCHLGFCGNSKKVGNVLKLLKF